MPLPENSSESMIVLRRNDDKSLGLTPV